MKLNHHILLKLLLVNFAAILLVICIHLYKLSEECYRMPIQKEIKISYYTNISVSEEISADERYGRKYFAWPANVWPSATVSNTVCFATQCTPNYLHLIELHARLWKGPISVAVYTPGMDFMFAYNAINYLRKCYPAVEDFVSFHIVFPLNVPALFRKEDIIDADCRPENVADVFETVLNVNRTVHSMNNYPQNHLRNTARTACPTSYSITADVDMIPWKDMSLEMNSFFANIEFQNCAYIVPVYEIHSDVDDFPPSSKRKLLNLININKARIFHTEVYKPNQFNSDLSAWEKYQSSSEKKIGISHRIKEYAQYWEPIIVMHSSAPIFFERFIGYGFTRSSHIYYLNLLHFHFVVLDNAFFSHAGFQSRSTYSTARELEIKANSKIYKEFKNEMERKYEK